MTRRRSIVGRIGRLAVCAGLVLASTLPAYAKPWKGAELITRQTFRYGAFEARIRAGRGSGVITPFFLWKDGSERPGAAWQEQDFEIFGRDGTFQTQLMTPGRDGTNRTEHVVDDWLRTPAWERYYTYRMEWTPEYLAFYVDGQLVRRETDALEFSKLMRPDQAEAAQLRVGIWAGDFDWSSSFDPRAVPATVFVNWIQAYSYTPDSGPNGSDFTALWRDDFDSLSSSRWWTANWTFDAAVNDYVSQNATAKAGALVLALTDEAGVGRFPEVPADDGRELPLGAPFGEPPFVLPARIEAEGFQAYFDESNGNEGNSRCGQSDVDMQLTRDSAFGYCNVGWTRAGEWLEYEISTPRDDEFDITLRASAETAGQLVHLEINGLDVSGPVEIPANGWQNFADVLITGVPVSEGDHVLRVVFDTGWVNLNYFDIGATEPSVPACAPAARTYQAENLVATTGGRVGNGWNLWSNGSLSTTHGFEGGNSVIRVNALGQPAMNVYPHMIVRVGSTVVGNVTVSANSYAAYDFFYSAPLGSQEVRVTFDNDYYANGQDRNLLLDSIVIEECVD